MPHVDEGTLHALLDGALRAEAPERAAEIRAHIAQCPDCRSRLEAAEELRGEASEVLEAAAPTDAGATPDFSAVVTRATRLGAAEGGAAGGRAAGPRAAGSDRMRRRARRVRAVAWAASLVIALGTGYLLRDLAGPTVSGSPFDSAPSATSADREATPPGVDETLAERAPDPRTGPAQPQTRAGEEDAAGGLPATNQQAAEGAAPPPPPAPPPTPRPEPGSGAGTAADAGSEEARRGRAVADTGRVVGGRVVGERVEGERVVAEPRLQLEAVTVDSLSAGQSDIQKSMESRATPTAANAPTEAFASAGTAVADTVRWSAISLEEARTTLEGPLFVLAQAELVEIYTLAGATPARVMTLQRLQTGVPVQVVQWRGGEADAEASEAVPATSAPGAQPSMDRALPGAEVARVVRGSYVLELTGSLPSALLRVLGDTARPAP